MNVKGVNLGLLLLHLYLFFCCNCVLDSSVDGLSSSCVKGNCDNKHGKTVCSGFNVLIYNHACILYYKRASGEKIVLIKLIP